MNSLRPLHWAAIVLGAMLGLYFLYTHLAYLTDVTFLAGIIGLEVLIFTLWKFEERLFVLLMITFLWAGMFIPLSSAGTVGRWVLLGAGSSVGFLIWLRAPRAPFRPIHLIAFFCICAAFTSATVSPFVQVAVLKSASLLLLFLYCAGGARLAVLGREERFFRGLVLGCEIAVYGTALCYFVLNAPIWGNPNSLGAAMSVGVFPVLLWAWATSEQRGRRLRMLVAVLSCAYLIRFSLARAGMVGIVIVSVMFFVGLHQYRVLAKGLMLVLLVVAVSGVLAPATLSSQLDDFKDAILYKGHKEGGVLGSRKEPWNESVASIKEHPYFGTGYGTSLTGEETGVYFQAVNSSLGAREHGSSYITIVEWEGLLGVWPFVALLCMTLWNVWKVFLWMRENPDPRPYMVPIAMIVLSGLVHAGFEDSIFAVGSYICLFFWFFAFLLADYVPGAVQFPAASVARRVQPSSPTLGAVLPTR